MSLLNAALLHSEQMKDKAWAQIELSIRCKSQNFCHGAWCAATQASCGFVACARLIGLLRRQGRKTCNSSKAQSPNLSSQHLSVNERLIATLSSQEPPGSPVREETPGDILESSLSANSRSFGGHLGQFTHFLFTAFSSMNARKVGALDIWCLQLVEFCRVLYEGVAASKRRVGGDADMFSHLVKNCSLL